MKYKIIKEKDVLPAMKKIGVDPKGIRIMLNKSKFRIIMLYKIRPGLANIIKEGMLSAGGDAALHKLSCSCKVEYTDILLMGTKAQYTHLLSNLTRQPYGGMDAHRGIKKLLT